MLHLLVVSTQLRGTSPKASSSMRYCFHIDTAHYRKPRRPLAAKITSLIRTSPSAMPNSSFAGSHRSDTSPDRGYFTARPALPPPVCPLPCAVAALKPGESRMQDLAPIAPPTSALGYTTVERVRSLHLGRNTRNPNPGTKIVSGCPAL